MNEEGEAHGSFTLCIDQVFIKSDFSACKEQPQSVSIVVDSREKHFEFEIIDIQINTPRRLDIKHDLSYEKGTQTLVDIRVFIADIIITHFEFCFSGNELRSYQQLEDGLFVRLIIRAFVRDPFSFKFKIFSLFEFSIRDIDRRSIEYIGRGSFGCVYSAEISGIKRRVALKCLPVPDIRDGRDSSIREVLPFISIPHHRCIVGIYGYIFNSNQFILILEYVENGSIYDHFPFKEKLIYSMIHCLCHIQSYGLIHRDLSPFNILLTSDYESKIIDFSISRFNDEFDLTEFQGNILFMAPEMKRHEHYGKEADFYSMIHMIYFITFIESRNAIEKRWELVMLIAYYNYVKEFPEDRLNFGEISILLESLFCDDEMANYIEATNLESSLNGRIAKDILLKKIFSLSIFMMYSYDIYGNILLEFASELLKNGFYDQYYGNDFKLGFYNLMLIGGIAFDLEFIDQKIDLLNNIKYDPSRLIYRINTCFRNGKFMEFNEKVGYRPCRNVEFDTDIAIVMALIYHGLKIVKIENESSNPILEQILAILDENNGPLEFYNLIGKVEACIEMLQIEKIQMSQNLWYEEIIQAVYSAIVDVGYSKMAVHAWKMFCCDWNKTMKYLKIAAENGDKKSIEYLNKQKSEEEFMKEYNKQQIAQYIENNDIPSALFRFLILNKEEIDKKMKFQYKEIKNYYLTLGLIYFGMKKYNKSIKYLHAACDEGSSTAKEFIEAFISVDYNKFAMLDSDTDFIIASDLAEQMLAIIGAS